MTEKTSDFFTLLVVAAGHGSRFGNDMPKQYQNVHGMPLLRHTLMAFLECPQLTNIQVIISKGHEVFFENAVTGLPKILPPVYGGDTRQESVANGLAALNLPDDAIVMIHDAARPCITPAEITGLLGALKTHRAATLCAPASETLRHCHDHILEDVVDRSNVVNIQTPQAFRYGDITTAHKKFADGHFTDDTSLASAAGIKVAAVIGRRSNIKLTYSEDMAMIEKLLAPTLPTPRTAMGFDVHAFGESTSVIRIGGIDIPHTHKLAGHSDADVALHAITDAVYGLVADGDIGSHFPPSNNDFKNMDSAVFLEDAIGTLAKSSGKITFIDVTIICEAPKIGPHRDAMRARIAAICGVDKSMVSVKATTTEQLGFTGRREGIAAQAVVTGLFPC